VLGAFFSALTGKPRAYRERESLGSELAAAEPTTIGEPAELVVPDMIPDDEAAETSKGQ
jgi:hypothetical protein